MANAASTIFTIWDDTTAGGAEPRAPLAKRLLKRLGQGIIKLGEAQYRAHQRRGFLPYT